jgi:hypothetical protein
MGHRVEPSPTARATCRGCKQTIAKGAVRFAEEFQNPYSEDGGAAFRYWHLACAARSLANELRPLLDQAPGASPAESLIDAGTLAEVKALVEANLRPEMPHAERAGSGRARCRACDVTIKKGELRVAFERTFDSPMGPQKGASYTHPRCVARYLERERERGRDAMDRNEVFRRVLSNSKLGDPDGEVVEREMTEGVVP